MAVLGIIALRRGEVENCLECVGPSSCIFPIAPDAVHLNKAGSREAVEMVHGLPGRVPDDLRVTWLLNIAYMTLGEYPDRVPRQFLIPSRSFRSDAEMGRFENVASHVGLTVARARTWRAGASSTTSTATACPTSSRPRWTPTWVLALHQPR